jgi:DNA-binding CsgD family transcriptional regulator
VLVEDWVLGWLDGAMGTLTLRAPKIAAELAEQALARMPAGDPRRERLGAGLVTVLRLLARYADLERVARPLLAEVTDAGCAGQIAWTLAYALLASGRHTEGVEVAEDALRRWPAVVPWAARLHALLALLFRLADRHEASIESARRAVAEGEQIGDRLAVGFGLHVLSAMTASTSATLAFVDRALAVVADDLEGADLRLLLYANRAGNLMIVGRPADAEGTVREALMLAERTGTPRLLTLRSAAATTYYHLGRWDDALVEIEIALELLEDRPVNSYQRTVVHGLAALIAAHRDDRPVLDNHLGLMDSQSHDRGRDHDLRQARALVAERAGRFDTALDLLASAVRQSEEAGSGHDRSWPHFLPTVVRLALAAGRREIAEWATGLCDRQAELNSGPFSTAAARRCHGLVEGNVADLRAAVDGYRGVGTIPELAGALEDLAVVCGEQGEVQAARAAHAEAVELYQGLGAVCDLARARSRVLPYGIGGGPHGQLTRPASGWYALTPTERRIAHLVAGGLSNPEIAAELYLSRRTVQSHVSHILTKLGARSRVEIAREAAHRAGATTPATGSAPANGKQAGR